jgi:exopolyphosphatase/guanosine-5'-triphosphate,3'-diphosphate pyrophosphatase
MTMPSMDPTNKAPERTAAATTVAAIDLGTNSLRMVIAEILPDGRIEVLERLQRAARLGQDTFRRGRLGGQSMRAALNVLKDFAQVLRVYNVTRVRAVATSAVREADNADTFLDRAFLAAGLHIEVIDPSEESRLVAAVRQALGDSPPENPQQTLIANVGGGSTLLTVMRGQEIVTSQSLRLGSIRLQEMLFTAEDPPERSAELLRYHIANIVASVQGTLPLRSIERFVAVGGDARFVARQVGSPIEGTDLVAVDPAEFDKLVARCQRHTAEELSKRYGLPFADAETLNPALLIYQILLRQTRAQRVLVSQASMCDGLLLELAREATGKEDESLLAGVIHSATSLVEKYHADLEHGRNVADLALRLFDELRGDHRLTPRHRLLLRIAALLHEVGGFVSNRAHHKHSEYLIGNSEIFGLNRNEITMVAAVARYHRRSPPQPTHPNFMALPRETRVVVAKLAAMLRVADALVRGEARQVRGIRFLRQDDDLVVAVHGPDLVLKQRAVAAKGDMFEELFGIKVRVEEG